MEKTAPLNTPLSHWHDSSPLLRSSLTACGVLFALLLTACNQTNGGTAAASLSEPGITAQLIDAETKQPVEGAVIYGYYATQTGTLGGGKQLGEQIKSFETQTDANGVFTLAAWNTGERKVSGQPISTFPVIVIYKPGYDMEYDTLSSIAKWRPKTGVVDTTYELKDNVYDWTKFPYLLKPLKNEKDRYAALNDSSFGLMFIGECGWEAYAKTLMVRHAEVINTKRRLIPADQRKFDDMPKQAYPLGVNDRTSDVISLENLLINPAPLHRIRDAAVAAGLRWKCSDPAALLREAESKLIGK